MVKLEDVLQGLKLVRDSIKKNSTQPGTLASLAIQASTVNSYLGDYLGALKHKYELERAKAFNAAYKEKPSYNFAEAMARAETAELKGQVNELEILHGDIQRIVSTIQTKVRTLEGEAKNQI